LNADQRGDIDQWNTWLSDVTVYLDQLAGPRIVLGISWGGILATALARQHPQLISGVGLICPGLFSTKAASAVQRLGLRIASAVGLKQMRVAVPLQDPVLFTNSKMHQAFVGQDPLALRQITIRMASCNVELLKYALSAPEEIRVPVLLMLASDDPIAINDRTRQWLNRIGHKDKTIIEYADASHTLEFEDDPSQYFDDLTAWCRRMTNFGSDGALRQRSDS
jgi:alpha-beta hydrolase superfamily lysophospholipase